MSRRGRVIKTDARDIHLTPMGLIKKDWKVHRTSLLLSRNEGEDRIKAETASRLIAMALPKMTAYTLSLTRCPAIQHSDNSPPALLVELLMDDAVLFLGYFINWSMWPDDDDKVGFRLPIYVFTGKVDVAKAVNQALMKAFDFVMSPVGLNPTQLVKLFTIFVKFSDENEQKPALLKYTIPGMAKKNNISVTNDVKSLLVILKFLVEQGQDDVSLNFYQKILSHYRGVYQLDLAHAELRHVALPVAMANDTGVIRMENEEVLGASLALLDSFIHRQEVAPALSIPSGSSSSSS